MAEYKADKLPSPQVNMTPEQRQKIKINLQEIAEIFYQNTPPDNLQSFESIELTVREHLVETVAPEISSFFLLSRRNCFGEKKNNKKLRRRNNSIG
jgi:hypothetical protein